MAIHYVDGECSYKELPPSEIEELKKKLDRLSSDKADTERVDNIDSTIEEIIEVIIPSLIDDGMDESEDL